MPFAAAANPWTPVSDPDNALDERRRRRAALRYPAGMRSTFSLSLGLSLSLILGTLLLARPAAACPACHTDADCPRGFGCGAGFGEPFCTPTGCNGDADCAPGMRCVTGVSTVCSGTTCSPMNACAPVWQAGCNVDADCGPGFTCAPGGTLCTQGNCTQLGECQATSEASCQSDADCPACWTCTTDPGQPCINPGGPPNGTGPWPPSPLTCRPPYWGLSNSYSSAGPPAGAASPAPACGGTGGGGSTTITGSACALGASGGGSWAGLAALLGAAAWGARRRALRKARRARR
jgi:hypothetical protein